MKNILVLGATGFIGGHIAKKALENDWHVNGFRRNPNSTGNIAENSINWISGDLDDYASLVEAMTGMDYVFHAGAWYPTDQNPKRAEGSLRQAAEQMNKVIKAAAQARIKRLIYTSSLTTIALPPAGEDRYANENDIYQLGTMPGNAYYEGKSIMEGQALEAAGAGQNIVILNPTLVLGPGDTKLSSSEILVMIAKGQAKAVPAGMINIIDVRDVAEAHINAARTGRSGQRYILGGENYQIMEAVKIITDMANVKPPLFKLSNRWIDLYIKMGDLIPFIPNAPYHLKAYQHWQGFQIEKAENELKLGRIMLEETARDSIKWFINQGVL